MTPSERANAFRRARLDVLQLRTQILRGTAADLTRYLKDAREEIARILASQPTDYQRWQLPQLKREVERVMQQIERRGGAALSNGARRAWEAGGSMIDKSAAAGGVRISAVLPHLDLRQLTAMRTFMVDKIKDIASTTANRIAGELGLVTLGAKSPGQAISAVADLLGSGRERGITIVRTEVGRAFSVAANERRLQAKEVLPGLKKQWRRSGKIYSRLAHDSIDGQIKDVDEPFVLGNGVRIMFPRDPAAPVGETINCGCEALDYMDSWQVSNPGRVPFTDDELRRSEIKRAMAA